MKNFKRILGIALAIIMIFNVFAIGTFAAFPDDALVKLSLSSEKNVFAPGEEIELIFSAQCSDVIGELMIGGGYDIAYNDAVIEPYSTSTALLDHGYTAIQAGDQAGISVVSMPSPSSSVTALNGWNTAILYNLVDSDVTFDATSEVQLFKLKVKVKADAEPGTYKIGFNTDGYNEMYGFINDGIGLGGIYEGWTNFDYGVDYAYELGTFEFTVATPSSKIIFHEDAMYNEAGTTEETAMLGFIGNFNKDDIGGFEFIAEDSHTLKNVTAVGVTLEIVGLDSITKTSNTIHPTATDGVYNFRAVLDSLDLAQYGNAEMKITYFITFTKDGVEDTQYSDTVPTTANAIIAGTF